eukprot:234088-Chlamydomonas_euryale.AAC.1
MACHKAVQMNRPEKIQFRSLVLYSCLQHPLAWGVLRHTRLVSPVFWQLAIDVGDTSVKTHREMRPGAGGAAAAAALGRGARMLEAWSV